MTAAKETPPRVARSQAYGRDLARLNAPALLLGEMSSDDLDDMVIAHVTRIADQIRERSNPAIDGVAEAAEILALEVLRAFDEELARIRAASPGAGNA